MALSPDLLEILACPQCKGDLDYREAESALVCRTCKLRYRIEDDIPVMLIEEATPLDEGE
ncbi:MAG: Trm112 family protein [Deferrisomatales bacterium]|nr:Trm112 family protein [Deferrisomatales bacterium]